MARTGSPHFWTRPRPSFTSSSCGALCRCQLVRPPGSNSHQIDDDGLSGRLDHRQLFHPRRPDKILRIRRLERHAIALQHASSEPRTIFQTVTARCVRRELGAAVGSEGCAAVDTRRVAGYLRGSSRLRMLPCYESSRSSSFWSADLRPRVAQRHRAVEDERAWRGIGVDAEVAEALELIARAGRGVREARLDLGAALHFERVRVQVVEEVVGRRRDLRA